MSVPSVVALVLNCMVEDYGMGKTIRGYFTNTGVFHVARFGMPKFPITILTMKLFGLSAIGSVLIL